MSRALYWHPSASTPAGADVHEFVQEHVRHASGLNWHNMIVPVAARTNLHSKLLSLPIGCMLPQEYLAASPNVEDDGLTETCRGKFKNELRDCIEVRNAWAMPLPFGVWTPQPINAVRMSRIVGQIRCLRPSTDSKCKFGPKQIEEAADAFVSIHKLKEDYMLLGAPVRMTAHDECLYT